MSLAVLFTQHAVDDGGGIRRLAGPVAGRGRRSRSETPAGRASRGQEVLNIGGGDDLPKRGPGRRD